LNGVFFHQKYTHAAIKVSQILPRISSKIVHANILHPLFKKKEEKIQKQMVQALEKFIMAIQVALDLH
jgi:hypothetical protein